MDPLSIIGTFGGLMGQIFGNMETDRQNDKARFHALQDYNRERQHALEDRDYDNWYNSPAQQMKRLKEGGINPHFAITKGGAQTAGISSGTRGVSTKQAQYNQKLYDKLNISNLILDLQQKQANVNLTKQNQVTSYSNQILHKVTSQLLDTREIGEVEKNELLMIQRDIEAANKQANIELKTIMLDEAKAKLSKLVKENEYLQKQIDWFDLLQGSQLTGNVINTVGSGLGSLIKGRKALLQQAAIKAHATGGN